MPRYRAVLEFEADDDDRAGQLWSRAMDELPYETTVQSFERIDEGASPA